LAGGRADKPVLHRAAVPGTPISAALVAVVTKLVLLDNAVTAHSAALITAVG